MGDSYAIVTNTRDTDSLQRVTNHYVDKQNVQITYGPFFFTHFNYIFGR